MRARDTFQLFLRRAKCDWNNNITQQIFCQRRSDDFFCLFLRMAWIPQEPVWKVETNKKRWYRGACFVPGAAWMQCSWPSEQARRVSTQNWGSVSPTWRRLVRLPPQTNHSSPISPSQHLVQSQISDSELIHQYNIIWKFVLSSGHKLIYKWRFGQINGFENHRMPNCFLACERQIFYPVGVFSWKGVFLGFAFECLGIPLTSRPPQSENECFS